MTDETAEHLRDFYLRARDHTTPTVALRAAVDACMEGRKPE